MVLAFSNGTITSSASEQNLFDVTADAHFATYVFRHNMQAGDTVTIKVYVLDENTATMRLYQTESYSEVQADPALFIPFMPTKQYRVSIQRTAGTDRAYTWQRIQST